MNVRRLIVLSIALLMFAQIAQTIYSPALADIGEIFTVEPHVAAQTLSVYFLGFAVGVVIWGRMCDRIGRRSSMLAGLAVYAAAMLVGLKAHTFDVFLTSQALAALGAAAASIVTQTVLRDRFEGAQLAQIFSMMGIALAASPAIGLLVGASLVQGFGYQGVLGCLLMIGFGLWCWCLRSLPETHAQHFPAVALFETLALMLRDRDIWRSTLLVALFNIALLSYYSVGPFVFQRLGLSGQSFGYSGAVLALGSGLGAWLNKRLLQRDFSGAGLVRIAAFMCLAGGIGVWLTEHSVLLVLAMLGVVLSFGMAIPNLLGAALVRYRDRLGTAGALFGLFYYLVIGAGLSLVGWMQALGESLIVCGALTVVLAGLPNKAHKMKKRGNIASP